MTARELFIRGMKSDIEGDKEDALRDISKALLLSPGMALAYEYRSALYRDMGRLEEAQADYDSFLLCNTQL